jgi:hypothetical protein
MTKRRVRVGILIRLNECLLESTQIDEAERRAFWIDRSFSVRSFDVDATHSCSVSFSGTNHKATTSSNMDNNEHTAAGQRQPCTAAKDKDRLSILWSQSLDVDHAARLSLGGSPGAPVRIVWIL